MSPELMRAQKIHMLLVDNNIDAEVIRDITKSYRWGQIDELPRMADEIIDYLIAVTG